jgi:hypothetical protein
MGMVIERFSIFLIRLDPTTGAEAAKTPSLSRRFTR